MAIFRGDGGAGDSNTDATITIVTAQAAIATTKASDAAGSAVEAANSATTSTTKASEASTSATNAANSATGVEAFATAAENSATAAATSATNSSTSATAAANSATAAASELSTAALKANNLSDLANAGTARTNLGLGTAAVSAATDYATAAQGSTANAALPKAGGALTGAVTTNNTIAGRNVATDGTKLDGIEASADVTDTANVVSALTAGTNITIAADGTIAASGGGGETLQQTLAIGNTTTTDTKIQFRDTGLYINSSADGQLDIVADTEVQIAATTVDVNGILNVSGNIVAGGTIDGRDVATDGTKLDGVEASADVTDATNVTAAGALMDSEVTNLAQVKAFDSANYATAAQGTLAANALPKAGGAMTGAITTNSTFDGRDVATDGTKLDGIEASADVTDTTNVTASGALMDSEITNLAEVKAFDSSDYATAAQGTLATNALPKAGGAMTGAITTNSTFDGRDVATDGTKLDGIEASATADQTPAEIRAAVEAATDSNVFTDADHTKLNAIEASADVTDTANVTAAGALMDSEVTNLAEVKAFDSADYATAAQGTLAAAALPKSGGAMTGAITTNSTFDGVDIATRDVVLTSTTTIANAALPKAGGAMTGAITTNSTFDGRNVATDGTKLDGIEASADVTDATNVTAAGALMDSEVTNLAEVKAFDSADYATAAQGTTANAALPKSGGAMTGAITTNSTFDGRDIATDGTKLDTVETDADVTDATNVTASGALMDSEVTNLAEVKAFDSSDYATAAQGTTADSALAKAGGALTGAITTNSTFDGRDVATDGTKLDTVETNADVTDVTNVTASGALMDSEVTNLSQVKAFASSDYATAAQGTLAASAIQANSTLNADNMTTGTLNGGTY